MRSWLFSAWIWLHSSFSRLSSTSSLVLSSCAVDATQRLGSLRYDALPLELLRAHANKTKLSNDRSSEPRGRLNRPHYRCRRGDASQDTTASTADHFTAKDNYCTDRKMCHAQWVSVDTIPTTQLPSPPLAPTGQADSRHIYSDTSKGPNRCDSEGSSSVTVK